MKGQISCEVMQCRSGNDIKQGLPAFIFRAPELPKIWKQHVRQKSAKSSTLHEAFIEWDIF